MKSADFDSLITSKPVNKTADLVTRSGVSSTHDEELEDLRVESRALQQALKAMSKSDPERQRFCHRFGEVSARICEIKKLTGKAHRSDGVGDILLSIIKDDIPGYKWRQYVDAAYYRWEQGIKNSPVAD